MRQLLVKYRTDATSEEKEKLREFLDRIGYANTSNTHDAFELTIDDRHVTMDTETIKRRTKGAFKDLVVEILPLT